MEHLYDISRHIGDILFPELILGEYIRFRQDEYGFWVRANKDLRPEDPGYVPNTFVNVIPEDLLNRADRYLQLSNLNMAQLEYVFRYLENTKLKVFNERKLESFLSCDTFNMDFELVKDDLAKKRELMVQNLYKLKEKYLSNEITPIASNSVLIVKQEKFALNLTVDEIAVLLNSLIETNVIQLRINQKSQFFQFITEHFSSKEQKDISAQSLKNKYYDLPPNAVSRIKKILIEQRNQIIKNDREV